MEFLGDTLAKIAAEKAGIIKSKTPVVIGEYHPETFGVFETVASELIECRALCGLEPLEGSRISRSNRF
jgi:folylpolyglutamate synthase/dihydropteroate synthase